MNEDAQDIFREMDAFADHLFARMAGRFDTDILQEHGNRMATGDDDTLPVPSDSPEHTHHQKYVNLYRKCTG